jgi:hypothetical protein
MPTTIDGRRLADGARGLGAGDPPAGDAAAWRRHVEELGDALGAMQSLGDLGSPEDNARAMRECDALITRLKAAEKTLARLERKGKR